MTTFRLPDSVRAILAPRPRLSVSQWAMQRPFLITEKGAIMPGPYNLGMTPYWREPMDAAADPGIRWMSIVASSQCGKTAMGMVWMAYFASERPANIMYVRPTEDDVAEAFRDRFRPMIEANLRELLPESGEWMVTTRNPAIILRSLVLYGAAATVPRQLTSRTTPRIWFDETDSGGENANELGNVLSLLDERQMAASARHSLTIGTSTPKHESGANWQAYEQKSDRREYHEPCPLCGTYQALESRRIRVAAGVRDPMRIRAEQGAWYECVGCGGRIGQEWQGWMADRGLWVPASLRVVEKLPVNDKAIVDHHALAILPAGERWEPRREGDATPSPHRGYRVWRANTKFEQCTWSNIVAKLFESQKDPEEYQVFTNNWEALPFKDAVGAVDEEAVRARIGRLPRGVVPKKARALLAACDVQDDCLWYVVRAFGAKGESWCVEYGTIEVAKDHHLEALESLYDRVFVRGWPLHGEGDDGLRMRAYALAVDSGYKADEVYKLADRPGVIATKGIAEAVYRVRKTQPERKNSAEPVELYWLNTLVFKNRLMRMVRIKAGEPGEWHLHAETTEEYVQHLTSEELRFAKKGAKVRTWQVKSGKKANHLLDCETMVLGLSEVLGQKSELDVVSLAETDPAVGLFRRGGKAERKRDEGEAGDGVRGVIPGMEPRNW